MEHMDKYNETKKIPGGDPGVKRTAAGNESRPSFNSSKFMTADEVSQEWGISKSRAYALIKDMNNELKEKGYYTIAGKVPRRFFEEKMYC